jgi:hypothetical protein
VIVFLGDTKAEVNPAPDPVPADLHRLGEQTLFTVRLDRLVDPRATHVYGVAGGPGCLAPALLGRTWGGLVWLGAGRAAYAIDPVDGTVVEHGFESPFMEFFVPRSAGVLVVAYETGLRGFDPDGAERWRTDTDLIEDLRWSQEVVVVEQMGRAAVEIPLATGRP